MSFKVTYTKGQKNKFSFEDTIEYVFEGKSVNEGFYWHTPGVLDAGYVFSGEYNNIDGFFYVAYGKSGWIHRIIDQIKFKPQKMENYKFSIENNKIKVEAKSNPKIIKIGE